MRTADLTCDDRHATVDAHDVGLAALAVARQAEHFAVAARRHYDEGDPVRGARDLASAQNLYAVARVLWPEDCDVHPGLAVQVLLAQRASFRAAA